MRKLLFALVAVVVVLVGCGGDESAPACALGRTQSCACSNGASGAQECGFSGVWGACVCTGSDAGADVSSAADADGSVADAGTSDASRDVVFVDGAPAPRLYESCDLGSDCGAGLECLAVPGADGGTRGVCSVRCTAATAERCPGALPYPGQVCVSGVCLVNCDRSMGPDPSVCVAGQRCVAVTSTSGPSGSRCVP